ncbi:MAG: DUF4129 domain-containing protein, partial [Halobacteriota archaeon]
MEARSVLILGLGITGILAVSVAGPALPTAVSFVDADAMDRPDLSDAEEQLLAERGGGQPEPVGDVSLPAEWIVLGVAVVGLGVLGRIALVHQVRRALLLASGAVVVSAFALLTAFWLGSGLAGVDTAVPDSLSTVLAGFFLLVVLGLGATSYLRRGDRGRRTDARVGEADDSPSKRTSRDSSRPEERSRFGADVPADNDVYRAWLLLERVSSSAEGRTMTPDEIRRAAHARGFDSDVVDELATLFESIRYGDATLTDAD